MRDLSANQCSPQQRPHVFFKPNLVVLFSCARTRSKPFARNNVRVRSHKSSCTSADRLPAANLLHEDNVVNVLRAGREGRISQAANPFLAVRQSTRECLLFRTTTYICSFDRATRLTALYPKLIVRVAKSFQSDIAIIGLGKVLPLWESFRQWRRESTVSPDRKQTLLPNLSAPTFLMCLFAARELEEFDGRRVAWAAVYTRYAKEPATFR